MGLISWIKDKYYNHKLDNADSAYQSGGISCAEGIYLEILKKQPKAAEHLAKMYFELATSRNEEQQYLNKLKSLLSKASFGKDRVSEFLARLILHIEKVAEQNFNNGDYNKASKYLKSIEIDKRGDTLFAKKNRLYALYVHLNALEVESSYTSTLSLIDTYCNKDVEKNIEDAIINTSKRLRESKKLDRAYCVSNCLAKCGNKNAIKECITVAFQIYKIGKSSDKKVIDEDVLLDYISSNNPNNFLAGLEPFALFSEKYKEKYISTGISVISTESDKNTAFTTFKTVWENTPDESLIKSFAKTSSGIASQIFDYFVNNIEKLTTKALFVKTLIQELVRFEDYNYVFDKLENYKSRGLDTKGAYVEKAKSVFNSLDDISRFLLINRVILNFHDDTWAINEKMSFGEKHQAKKEYAVAINLYKELIGLHADAELRLAQLYFEQYRSESNFLKRRDLLRQAYSFKHTHNKLFNSKDYNKLLPHLLSSVVELIKDCFANNNPEEAYNTAILFKAFASDCFTKYIKELREYHDVAYILSKLEALKNEGIDIESDYKDTVNRVISSELEDNYKLNVLSKALDIFPDDQLSKQFIQTAIDVIKQEDKYAKVVSVFGKIWRKLADPKLLIVFVKQDYIHHTSIVDYLVNRTSVSRWKKELLSTFCNQIFEFADYKYSLSVFDRLSAKGIDVQKSYVASVIKALPSLNDNEKLSLLNNSLVKYSDEYLINEKIALSDTFATEGNYEIAEKILIEMVGLHKMAETKLATLHYEVSKTEKDLYVRQELIKKGLAFHLSHSSLFDIDAYSSIFKKLLSAFTSLIDKYYANNECHTAYQLCVELKKYSNEWYLKYIDLRTDAVSKIETCEEKISFIYETFNTLDSEGYSLLESNISETNSLWNILSFSQISDAKSRPYKECVDQLQDYSHYITKYCPNEKANVLLKEVNGELATILKSHGYASEQNGAYSEAISSYAILATISDIRTKSWCKIRSIICNIKDEKNVSEEEVRKVLCCIGFAKEKKDLAYRYSLYLIKNRGAKESLSFVSEFLPDEVELISACNNEYIKEAESLLNDLNQIIDRFNHGLVSLTEARDLADRLNDYDEKLSPYLKGVHTKITALQPSIQSYILLKCYEEGDYEQALKCLKDTGKNWYEDNVFFRNLAIACLGIAETSKINKVNYKTIISCWLTAIYQDQLFVDSLDYTSWDDSYNFTLDNSLGGSKDSSFDSLPENVNFDEPIEGSVISIAEVQQSLLNRFETALNGKDDVFREFYEEQKDAMDSLVRLNMDNPCVIAAPYMANNTRKCLNEIKRTLDYEYDNYGSENILKVGVLYGINSGVFENYKDAISNIEACISAASSKTLTKVRSSFTDSSIASIQEFPELYSSFITEIQNILSSIIRGTTSYKTVLNIFSVICQVLNESTLSYIFGNFINQSIVAKLNEESLDLASGLKDLVSAYKVARSCSQLKNNVANVLEALIGKYITEANSSDFLAIKSVLSSTGSEFESNVANTLSETEQIAIIAMATGHPEVIENLTSISARTIALRNRLAALRVKAREVSLNLELSQIVEKVNNNEMPYSSALQRVYSLYNDNKDNSRVCDNLCTLIDMCINEYVIPDKYEKSTVMSVFNQLKYNKSEIYKISAQTLKDKRQEILNSFDWKLRNLLTGGTAYGSELNAEGKKLKNALQLYLDLA